MTYVIPENSQTAKRLSSQHRREHAATESYHKPKIHAVDLFCGAGGLTCGLRQAGVLVKAGVDIATSCRYAYSHNNHADFVEKSVTELKGDDIERYLGDADFTLLAGCAPCQAFSTYNRKSSPADPRRNLLMQFARLVEENRPDLVTTENVPQLADKDVFEAFRNRLKELGYFIDWKVVRCEEYGLPQHRHRLVLLASKLGEVKVLSPEEYGAPRRTVRDVIGSLPPIEAGGISPTDTLHRARGLTPINMLRMKASKPGGTWRDWPEALKLECHKRETGASYVGVYGRMKWDEPSPTMTTQFIGYGSGRFGHPEQDRALTLREGAMLQSFPRDYKFVSPDEPLELSTVARMIGNAVPVVIGELIGKSIFAHLKSLQTTRRMDARS